MSRKRFRWSEAVWWACQDLNLGPHPYQAHSRDAFKQLEARRPGLRQLEVDRDYPLGTGLVRLMWHVGGTPQPACR
jgi:hypothetical protein